MTQQNLEDLSFEQALARLEAIVRRLEEGNVPLEDGLVAFEEGTTLSLLCQQRLDTAERRVEQLLEKLPPTDGTIGT
ncbi:MAG: exodeoxyribonuclease VII small subunit [Magnetococcales bacterium]|nr:exodeoxyribonuclease VII small subunit [Magnetococcales bacterium]